jgi:hypothetical protein
MIPQVYLYPAIHEMLSTILGECRAAGHMYGIGTFGWLAVSLRVLTGRSSKQQQIPIRILDDETLGTPRLSS